METAGIKEQRDFSDTPEGWANYWDLEFEAADKSMDAWHKSATISLDEYKDEGKREANDRRVNLFWANVTTQKALMYGRLPSVDVSRRFADSVDDTARVAGPVILQRLLNTDIERSEDGFRHALRHALCDYLIVGYGSAHLRYDCQFEEVVQPARLDPRTGTVLAPEVKTKQKKRDAAGNVLEDLVTEYSYWKNQRWGSCRFHEELPWWAFSTSLTRDEARVRFPECADDLPYNSSMNETVDKKEKDHEDPWDRVEVWEIWSKRHKRVFWRVKGYDKVLDDRPDPLGLRGFWPFPRPLMANSTTDKYLPRTDFAMAQDLYNKVNELSLRIGLIEGAIRAAGVYDENAGEELEALLTETGKNVLIPVKNFALIGEKGGLDGVISWMKLDQLSLALEKLQAQLAESQRLLYEVTGWSDLMRGQAMDGGETATAAAGKMKYASVRIQFQQSEFARFASELQELRAEAIVNLYDPDTIKRRSNVEQTPDRDVADQAIALLKAEFPSYRIQVRSEALAQQDFATLTAERTQFITSVGALIQGLGPSLQTMGPDGQLLLLEIVKWTAAGFRGGQSIEGVLDKFITKASKAVTAQAAAGPRQQPPDPKLAVNAQKTQGDIQKAMIEHKLELEKLAAEAATEERIQGAQARFNVAEEDAKQTIKTREEGRRQAMKPRPQGAKPRPKPQSGGV